jgi:ABC-type uncharacterized transport system permease subunit
MNALIAVLIVSHGEEQTLAAMIGSLLGIIVGAALLGALIAWIIRKIVSVSVVVSYAIGVALATLIYMVLGEGLSVRMGAGPATVAVPIVCGLVAFGILVLTSRRASRLK